MYQIGDLVKAFSLSRSTLLYYHRIGLLVPSGRTETGYRLYSQADYGRLAKICVYRDAGLSLSSIADGLNAADGAASRILEARLDALNREIGELRQQQRLILDLLGTDSLLRTSKVLTKDQWVKMLASAGMDDEAMHRWHVQFERDLPDAHTGFLESLGISALEVEEIKRWAKDQ